jgi:lipoprotein-anchoring transpeptidase ErfK/SrfK
MFDKKDLISRRTFLERSLVGLGGMAVLPMFRNAKLNLDEFPAGEWLGRNTVYLPSTLPIRAKPSADANVVRYLSEDECVVWLREVVGSHPTGRVNRKWVETPEGYVYSPSLQKVRNIPNEPISTLPQSGEDAGMWVEVTVPYVNLTLENPPAKSPWLNAVSSTLWRLYYSQVIWVNQIKTAEDGSLLYRVEELYGTYGDIFWADARAFRVITAEEMTPINPEVTDKKIIVDVNAQSLTCYEGNSEVYYCQVATGKKLDELGNPVETWATPVGNFWVWRKLYSLHMSGGSAGATEQGFDTMAIPWTCLFQGDGVAIHGAFWHNDFGTPKSHGCVNTTPEDAKWIFRWTTPQAPYYKGDISDPVSYTGTKIEVVQRLY